jgi:hypothetical protein
MGIWQGVKHRPSFVPFKYRAQDKPKTPIQNIGARAPGETQRGPEKGQGHTWKKEKKTKKTKKVGHQLIYTPTEQLICMHISWEEEGPMLNN